MSNANFGMMDGAYFVGRMELLAWINSTFQLPYTKIEETASGALACHIMDAIFPGQIPLGKVDFNAKYDYEYVKNYKILQTVFAKNGIDKVIPVDRLILGKYQDNLEFIQWLKRYFDLNAPGDYDALARRKEAKCDCKTDKNIGAAPAAAPKKSHTGTRDPRRYSVATMGTTTTTAPVKPTTGTTKATAPKATTASLMKPPAPKPKGTATEEKIQQLTQQTAELKLTIDNLEKERDFYFEKLQEVEKWAQDQNETNKDFVATLFTILYASNENAPASTGNTPREEAVEETETF
jgi:RP/EB family microtubule-associated protein